MGKFDAQPLTSNTPLAEEYERMFGSLYSPHVQYRPSDIERRYELLQEGNLNVKPVITSLARASDYLHPKKYLPSDLANLVFAVDTHHQDIHDHTLTEADHIRRMAKGVTSPEVSVAYNELLQQAPDTRRVTAAAEATSFGNKSLGKAIVDPGEAFLDEDVERFVAQFLEETGLREDTSQSPGNPGYFMDGVELHRWVTDHPGETYTRTPFPRALKG